MAVNPKAVFKRRETITALPLYHAGHLQKKNSTEKDFKKFFGELRGTTLFLYKDDTQDAYTEKMDLENLKSMELKGSFQKNVPAVFTLNLHSEEMHLKIGNPDSGMEWKGYILTVTKKEIPKNMMLLPGQRIKLQDVLTQERKRNPTQRPPLPPRPDIPHADPPSPPTSKDKPDLTTSEMPGCFYDVTRDEAERMLEENPEYGNIILRPSTLANNYALTLRQQKPSGTIKRNFRVTSTKSGLVIELDVPVTVSSLNEVVNYFLEKTEYRLQPYRKSQHYDTRFDASPALKINLTSPAPKMVPKAQVAPTQRSETIEKVPPPSTEPEGDYVEPDDTRPDNPNKKMDKKKLDEELREALKVRRADYYAANDTEEGRLYMNQTQEESQPVEQATAQWNKTSSKA
ncbi:signal-transducing adaptor protein 1-like [Notolabrus celidotus]|uniref:signal-transducing adaptor protein 1-like n=1 Tax=Notolabrus celidotus TaxID=1203425 RepID=UPI00149057ED|nr:signal-transducing adaptor protein 1-like [Notolabrus celidotus]